MEPDLVILDEFQRFRDLLDLKTGGEAAETGARVLQPVRRAGAFALRNTV